MAERQSAGSETYLNYFFRLLEALNLITVLFLLATIVATQYRIADSQAAGAFLAQLSVIPERPVQRILFVTGGYVLLCLAIHLKRVLPEEKREMFSLLSVFEIAMAFVVMWELNMSYNGIVFLVVAEMIGYVEERWNKFLALGFAFVCYIVCSYHISALFFSMNSFETWISYYDATTEKYFLGLKTVCEMLNIVLFLVYIFIHLVEDKREKRRIRILNDRLHEANEQLHEANEQLREYAKQRELMGETRERNRLAREIHDTLGHILTGISVGVDAASVLMEVSPDAAKEQLTTIGNMARRGLNDVRRSVRKLKPDALENLPLNVALHEMIEEMSAGTNTKIFFISYKEELAFEPDEEETIYRIIQESITNAIRHGGAREIWIRLNVKDEELLLIVSDNGKGCEGIEEGFGLRHMRERVELLNGTVQFKSISGFTVIARIPVRRKNVPEMEPAAETETETAADAEPETETAEDTETGTANETGAGIETETKEGEKT